MKVELLLKNLKKVKDFAKESSPYDLAKNVRVVGTEEKVVLQCCDGESGITQIIDQISDVKKIMGSFCANVFTLTKTIAELDPGADVEIVADLRSNLVMKGKGFRFPLKALPDDRILAFNRHKGDGNWQSVSQEFFSDLSAVSIMTTDESCPVTYDGRWLYSAGRHIVAYAEVLNAMQPFKLNAKLASKLCSDQFDSVDVTESHIFCKNSECEIFVGQTSATTPQLEPLIKTFAHETIHCIKIKRDRLKSVCRQASALGAWGNIDKNASLEIHIDGEKSRVVFEGSEMDLDITEETPAVSMRISVSFLETVTQKRDTEFIEVLYHQHPTMFIARVDKIVFVGGLRKSS